MSYLTGRKTDGPLTDTQNAIMIALCSGSTQREVAIALGVTPTCIAQNVAQIRIKLEASTTYQAVALYAVTELGR